MRLDVLHRGLHRGDWILPCLRSAPKGPAQGATVDTNYASNTEEYIAAVYDSVPYIIICGLLTPNAVVADIRCDLDVGCWVKRSQGAIIAHRRAFAGSDNTIQRAS